MSHCDWKLSVESITIGVLIDAWCMHYRNATLITEEPERSPPQFFSRSSNTSFSPNARSFAKTLRSSSTKDFAVIFQSINSSLQVMAGVAAEGSQFDTRQFDTKMNELEAVSAPSTFAHTDMGSRSEEEDSLTTAVVVFSTLVAVCGSYVYGSAVGFSSPAQMGIMDDLDLSLEETIGLSQMFCCLFGWLAILYSEVS
ncbi:hypothetical protein L1887_05558 [Cichorium endivia]|nr:hypothetical protein L1887_05558 [Cichorium endivia]